MAQAHGSSAWLKRALRVVSYMLPGPAETACPNAIAVCHPHAARGNPPAQPAVKCCVIEIGKASDVQLANNVAPPCPCWYRCPAAQGSSQAGPAAPPGWWWVPPAAAAAPVAAPVQWPAAEAGLQQRRAGSGGGCFKGSTIWHVAVRFPDVQMQGDWPSQPAPHARG